MIITLVFPTFGFSFHNAIHEVISVIPAWRSNIRRETEGLLRSIQVLSANRDTPGLRTGRSLTKARKSNGPRVDPCGTPEQIGIESERTGPSLTD